MNIPATRFFSMKEAEAEYERIKRTCGMPFEQWFFGRKVKRREIGHDEQAADFIREHCHLPEDHENFWVICIDAEKRAICAPVVVGKGVLNGVLAGAREVFAPAIWWGAYGIVVAHNHPAGGLEPSKKDRELTRELQTAGKVLRIPLFSHIIVTPDGFKTIRVRQR